MRLEIIGSSQLWFAVMGTVLSVVAPAPAATPSDAAAWDASYDASTGTRFIPVELWTGTTWTGHRDIVATPAHLSFGKHGKKTIDGPFEWTRPVSGEKLLVYRRVNGNKEQLFTISSRNDGIGRVYDSRYGRDCIDEVKFPLGVWHQAQSRLFDVPCNDGATRRQIRVTIQEIDFVYQGVAHSLRFHWQVLNDQGRATDMHYTYQPGLGLVDEVGNE